MFIQFKQLTCQVYDLEVEESDTVEDVKHKIRRLIGVPADQQILNFAGEHLKDERLLSEYRVTENCCIHLRIRLRGGGVPSAWIVVLASDGSRRIPYYLTYETQIGKLKTSIAEKLDTLPDMIRFVYNGSEFADDKEISDLPLEGLDLERYCLCVEPRFESDNQVGYTLRLKQK